MDRYKLYEDGLAKNDGGCWVSWSEAQSDIDDLVDKAAILEDANIRLKKEIEEINGREWIKIELRKEIGGLKDRLECREHGFVDVRAFECNCRDKVDSNCLRWVCPAHGYKKL